MYRSNVMMACNWLVGRGKYQEVGEDEDLYVPPAALAGKNVHNPDVRSTAGKNMVVWMK